jgi:hypothetical protein
MPANSKLEIGRKVSLLEAIFDIFKPTSDENHQAYNSQYILYSVQCAQTKIIKTARDEFEMHAMMKVKIKK